MSEFVIVPYQFTEREIAEYYEKGFAMAFPQGSSGNIHNSFLMEVDIGPLLSKPPDLLWLVGHTPPAMRFTREDKIKGKYHPNNAVRLARLNSGAFDLTLLPVFDESDLLLRYNLELNEVPMDRTMRYAEFFSNVVPPFSQ